MESKVDNPNEMNLGLPDNLDYKIILGYEGQQHVDVIVFDTKKFEETGCEFSSEVFRVTLANTSGSCKIITVEKDVKNVHRIDMFSMREYTTLPPNCS